jgi:hypothetical protein
VGCGHEVAVAGDYVYVVGGWWKVWESLVVVNVSDPANPTEVGHYDYVWRPVGDVAATGGCAYIAADGAGLLILCFTGSEPASAPGSTTDLSPSPASEPPSTPPPRRGLCLGSALLLPLLLLSPTPRRPRRPKREGG